MIKMLYAVVTSNARSHLNFNKIERSDSIKRTWVINNFYCVIQHNYVQWAEFLKKTAWGVLCSAVVGCYCQIQLRFVGITEGSKTKNGRVEQTAQFNDVQKSRLISLGEFKEPPACRVLVFLFPGCVVFTFTQKWSYKSSSIAAPSYRGPLVQYNYNPRSVSVHFLIVAGVSQLLFLTNRCLHRLRVPLCRGVGGPQNAEERTEQITTSNLTPLNLHSVGKHPINYKPRQNDSLVLNTVPILTLHKLKHGLM